MQLSEKDDAIARKLQNAVSAALADFIWEASQIGVNSTLVPLVLSAMSISLAELSAANFPPDSQQYKSLLTAIAACILDPNCVHPMPGVH